MSTALKLILVEDSPTDARLVREMLGSDSKLQFELEVHETIDQALAAVTTARFDLGLVDLGLPGCRDLDALERMHGVVPCLPLLVLTGLDDERVATRAVAAGAQDYLPKDGLDGRTLVRAIRHALERARLRDQLHRLNDDLEQRVAERTRDLELFAHSISHDLRSPLQIIDGYAQILREDLDPVLRPDQRGWFVRLDETVRRMAGQLDGLLRYSRAMRAEVRVEPVDLSAAAQSLAMALSREDPGRAVRFVIAEGLHVEGDRHLLSSVVENLVRNAWKFSLPRDPAVIEVGRCVRDDEPVYFVRDNGVGFDPADTRRLFEPFRRLSGSDEIEGSGIGLAAARMALERHGGRIWAEAEPDAGATFYFTLPR